MTDDPGSELKEIKLKIIFYKTNTQGYELERFVYIPVADSSFVTTVNQNSYIRDKDVINRLGRSCQAVYAKSKESHSKKDQQPPFGAWTQYGEIIPIRNDMTDYYRGLLYGKENTYATDERMFQKWFSKVAYARKIVCMLMIMMRRCRCGCNISPERTLDCHITILG